MTIQSDKQTINASQEAIRNFLKNSENLYEILPQESISDWNADKNQCSFKVQGGVTITLVQDGDNGADKVFMRSGEKSPFAFTLTTHLNQNGDGTEGYIEFDGNVNMFLKMMVEKPLKNLFNYMADKLKAKFENS